MLALPKYSILLCLLLITQQFPYSNSHYSPFPLEELDEDSLLNLLISDQNSIILFHSPIEDANPPPILNEYDKLSQMLVTSGLEIGLYKSTVEPTSPTMQYFNIKELPCIKLIVNGRPYEYAGKKTASTLFQDIERKFYKTVLQVSSQQKLESLLNGERGMLVYFDNDSTDPAYVEVPDISVVRRTFEMLIDSFDDYFIFAIAKGVKTVSYFDGFQGKNGDIVLFRKSYPFHVLYTGELDTQDLSRFLVNNALPKVNIHEEKLHDFVKDKRLAYMLVVVKPEDAQIEEEMVQASKEIGDELILSLYYDEKEDFTRQRLQRLIGSAAPFTRSQLFILDYRSGSFKFYRMEKDVTSANILEFYRNWKNGVLRSLLRSELLPPRSDDSVEKVVGRNYLQRVMIPEYDAYVIFHFEGCGEACERMIEMSQNIASQFNRFRVLKFFKIDLSLNDIPDLQLQYIPAFGVYTRNDKTLQLYEEETISFKKMIHFVNEWSKLLTKEEYEALEKEVEGQELDRLIENLRTKNSESTEQQSYYGDL